VATTTFWEGPVDPVEALIATRTKAAITSRARIMPRKVKGLRDVIPVKVVRKSDPS